MYSIIDAVSRHCSTTYIESNRACKITKIVIATLLTLGVGSATFSAIFFTAHLLIPSLITSVSLMILLEGIDICILICRKKKDSLSHLFRDYPGDPPFNNNSSIRINDETSKEEDVATECLKSQEELIAEAEKNEFDREEETNTKGTKDNEVQIQLIEAVLKNADLFNEIAKFLSTKEICQLGRVCKKWKMYVGEDFILWAQTAKKTGYIFLDSKKMQKGRQIHRLESIINPSNRLLNDEELLVNIQFLTSGTKKENIDECVTSLNKTVVYLGKKNICENYYVEKVNENTIVIKHLKDPTICHHIQRDYFQNAFEYEIMNGYLITKGSLKKFFYYEFVYIDCFDIWRLSDFSQIPLSDNVKKNFPSPYIYKNFLVSSANYHTGINLINIYDLDSKTFQKFDNGPNGVFHALAQYEEKVVIYSRKLREEEILLLNLNTKKMTCLFNDNLGSPFDHRIIILNREFLVLNISRKINGLKKSFIFIYKNLELLKSLEIPEYIKDLMIIGDYLLVSSSNKTSILNLQVIDNLSWENRKEYSLSDKHSLICRFSNAF